MCMHGGKMAARRRLLGRTRESLGTTPCPSTRPTSAVIGAWDSAGCSTALSRRAVARASVLDDGRIGGGEHWSSAHLASARRRSVFQARTGDSASAGARLVAESHAAAIHKIQSTVRELAIDCDFRRVEGYLLTSRR